MLGPFSSSPFCAGDRGRLGVGDSGFPREGSAPGAFPLEIKKKKKKSSAGIDGQLHVKERQQDIL